ncbi:hypothetical protein G6F56_009468 [Rhizopus delemar]|nr:hypothetical protein G6F56_009468 [Rhizopus delemar]
MWRENFRVRNSSSHYCIPCKGVYVADASGVFCLEGDDGWIIKSIDDKEAPDLNTFIEVMKTIPDYACVSCVYYSIADVHSIHDDIISIDRHWSSFRLAVRNNHTGLWVYAELGEPLPPVKPLSVTKRIIEFDYSIGPAKKLDSFNNKYGSGVIVDKEKGLVVVSRGIVPSSLGDVTITVANSIVIPAKVLFLHPTHNYSIVQYYPVALGDMNVMSAPMSDTMVSQGHEVIFVAYNHRRRPVFVRTTPRYRTMNQEVIALENLIASRCPVGLLADQVGRVQALWFNFLGNSSHGHEREYPLGIHISTILPILERLRQGKRDLVLRSLNLELMAPHILSLYAMGLSDAWVNRIEEANPTKHQLFMN